MMYPRKNGGLLLAVCSYLGHRYLTFTSVRLLTKSRRLKNHGVNSHCVQIVHYHLSFTGVY